MFYLQTLDGSVLMDYGNASLGGTRVMVSDRFDDRAHFYSKEEAIAVANLLPYSAAFEPVEEPFHWVFSHLSSKLSTLYRLNFPGGGTIFSKVDPSHRVLQWETLSGFEVYLSLSSLAVCIVPQDPIFLSVEGGDRTGSYTVTWSGLDRAFLDREMRRRLETLAIDFWSFLRPYEPSIKRLNEQLSEGVQA